MSQLTTQRLQSMSTPELQGIMEGEDANAKKFEDRFGFWNGMDKNDLEDMITEMRDADYGLTDFEDFCSTLGYDTDSRRAEKIWKACQRATNKLNKIGLHTDNDFFSSLLSWLED